MKKLNNQRMTELKEETISPLSTDELVAIGGGFDLIMKYFPGIPEPSDIPYIQFGPFLPKGPFIP